MQIGPGELYSLGAAACWGAGVVLYRRLGEALPPVALNLLKNGIVMALMVPTVLLVHGLAWPQIPAGLLVLAALSGFLGITVADSLYFKALNTLGAGRIGVIGNLFSPFVILLSFLFLDERLNALQFVGFALVMGGVLLVNQREKLETLPREVLRRGVWMGVAAVALNAIGIVMVKPVLEQAPFFWVALIRLVAAFLPMLWLIRLMPAHHRMPELSTIPWRLLIARVRQLIDLCA